MSDSDTDSDMEDLLMQMGMVDATDLNLDPIENLDERTGHVWAWKNRDPVIPQDKAQGRKSKLLSARISVRG